MSYLPLFLASEMTLAEKFALSVEMFIRGMGTVFMVLIILWGFLSLFRFFSTSENKAASKPQRPAPTEEKKVVPVPAPVATNTESATVNSDDTAVIAAICAAIEAYRASEGLSGLPYRVVSFKRKTGHKSWSGEREE